MATIDITTVPVISVCIANYQGINLIESCIDSILGHTGDIPVEIIVHDDCSSDGSAELIAARYPHVRVIRSEENVGFCASNNRMAQVARGEYLLLLNNDATLFPDAVRTLYEAAREANCPAILSLPQYYSGTGELIDIGCLLDPFLNPVPNLDRKREDVGMVIGACLWIPKALWKELGGFPEWFESIGEDLYLCCRARLAGYPVRALATSGYRHMVGTSFGGGRVREDRMITTRRRRALSERNKTYVMVLCQPAPVFHVISPIHLLLLMVEGMLLSLAKQDAGLMREIYAPVISALWQERARLAELRMRFQVSRRRSVLSWLAVFRPWPYKLKMLLKYGLPDIR